MIKNIIVLGLAIVFALVLSSCGGNSAEDTQKNSKTSKLSKNKLAKSEKGVVINVEADKVFRGDSLSVYETTTLLEADLESDVTSKASGIILKINVEIGDVVTAGDVLAVLESDLQQLRLQSAEANYQKSLHNYKRAQILLKKGLANQESVDNLKFETRALKTNLQQAQLDLDFTQIKAPISGVITQRNIKKGNLIQVNTAVYQIVDFDSLQAVINVPENKWGLFKQGLEVIFDFAGIKTSVTGEILRIDPIIDSVTGTFRVVISMNKSGESSKLLRPGLFGKTKIVLDKRDNVLLINKNAIIREDKNSYVYVVNEDRSVTKKDITIGYEMPNSTEVVSGLEEGQLVITVGKNNVSVESTVEIIKYND